MAIPYRRIVERAEIPHQVDELGAKTLIVDVEPLVAYWNTGRSDLRRGVAGLLDQLTATTAVRAVVFATNSARTLPELPTFPAVRIGYLASARKPLRTAPYRDLPRPGAVIGDQIATDGVLARRLGYAFLHYCPDLTRIPPGPRLMYHLGRLIPSGLFDPPALA